jgi:hypothetical protein
MKKKNKTIWRLVAKSLGEKSGKDDMEADKIAVIRLLMFLSIFITNGFIIFNAVRTHIFPRDYIQKVECINLK